MENKLLFIIILALSQFEAEKKYLKQQQRRL